MLLASSVTTGTRKKFPMAVRNRCSSTLPESSTCVVQEPPLRFCASWAASSRDATPPAIKRSMIDLLTVALMSSPADSALRSPFSLRQMQCPPDRSVQLTSYAHGIILLETGDSETYLVRKNAIDPTTIVSAPLQIPLQCGDVSRLGHQLFVSLEIIDPTPAISVGIISRAHRRHLVKQV